MNKEVKEKPMIRSCFYLTKAQVEGLKQAAKADPDRLTPSHLIRRYVDQGLARAKRHGK
jgi:hypothetical protein